MNLLISLFSPVVGTWGRLTRGLAIAEAARTAGHNVAFCAAGYSAATLRDCGYRVYETPAATVLGLPRPLSRFLVRCSQQVALPIRPGKEIENIWVVFWISGYARAGYLRHLVPVGIAAARDFRADRILTDINPAAYLLAAVTGIPLASTYTRIATEGSSS